MSTYFKYLQEEHRLIYTTNTIKSFNRQFRKVTKPESVFPTDDSLLKTLYLAMIDITKKWNGRREDRSVIYSPDGNLLLGIESPNSKNGLHIKGKMYGVRRRRP